MKIPWGQDFERYLVRQQGLALRVPSDELLRELHTMEREATHIRVYLYNRIIWRLNVLIALAAIAAIGAWFH